MPGEVVGIFVSPGAGEPMSSMESALAIAGRGLEGDRYESGSGFYSNNPTTPGGRELTLIEAEVIAALQSDHGIALDLAETRRNVATTGVDLGELLGKRFSIGTVVCEGVRDCPPCVHLEELVEQKVMKPLVRRGGLRARIVEGGTIQVGDPIESLGEAEGPFADKGKR